MKKVFASVLTHNAPAANNRGETRGNVTTLHQFMMNGLVHTSVSGEAIRAGIRYRAQVGGEKVFREFNEETGIIDCNGKEHSEDEFFDDDLFGHMLASEGDEPPPDGEDAEDGEEAPKKKKKKTVKGKCDKRTSPLMVSRATSLAPWEGTVSYNCQNSPKGKADLSLYGAEMHGTRYQFVLGIDIDAVKHKERIPKFFDYLADVGKVGGNQSRFLYDFSPATVVYRITNAQAPRLHNSYSDSGTTGSLAKLIDTIEAGDLPAGELIVGGEIARGPEGEKLKALGVTVCKGVLAATEELKKRLAKPAAPEAKVGTNGVAKSLKTAVVR
jgi:CRISPR-associated protein Cst2